MVDLYTLDDVKISKKFGPRPLGIQNRAIFVILAIFGLFFRILYLNHFMRYGPPKLYIICTVDI